MNAPSHSRPSCIQRETADTYVWREEHDWLRTLLHSVENKSPQFRVPDLIGACVAIVFRAEDAPDRLFQILRTELVLRDPNTPRRQEKMWRSDFVKLQTVQRSAANQYPNPHFALDELLTACICLVRGGLSDERDIFQQARRNTVLAAATAAGKE